MVNIPVNTYKVPTECREEVVQLIVDAFLESLKGVRAKNYNYNTLELGYCNNELYVSKCINDKGEETSCLHWETYPRHQEVKERYRLRSCEVNEAIKSMVKAGYFFYEYWHGWNGKYCTVSCKNRQLDLRTSYETKEITSFNFKID